jgi:putative transferase (TIGR04331 family)
MKERFLVTTALEDSWPENGEPVIFLGEWCRLFSRKKIWEKMDSEVLPYHWDDRDKLHKDYKVICSLFEKILNELTIELNKVHSVNHSSRYWRILIGPWLINFIPIIFDRWSCLNKSLLTCSINAVIISDSNSFDSIPLNMTDFVSLQEDDLWNSEIYSMIIKLINFDGEVYKKKFRNDNSHSTKKIKKSDFIKDLLGNILTFFSSNNSIFIITPYIGRLLNLKLHLKLFQLPCNFRVKRFENEPPSANFREWKFKSTSDDTVFSKIVKELIPLQMPTVYLESYKELRKKTKNVYWPKNPKLIWTSNSYYLDDFFKLWAAEKVEKGTPFVIGQHGGHYGQGLFSFPEYHELHICDHYLSWGWKTNKKVIPIGFFKKKPKLKQLKGSNKNALLVLSSAPRYSGTLMSIPISSQMIKYMDDQFEFYKSLSKEVTKSLLVRLYPNDYGWSQRERWREAFPDSVFDNNKDFNKSIQNVNLVIAVWNSTTYLEVMALDIPLVLFWNPSLFELNMEAVMLFDELKKVGIFHESPSSAARHVAEIWDDIDSWWSNPDVVKAKNNFIDNFAKPVDLVNDLQDTLLSISYKTS